jgi:hypothetical protein
MMLRGVTNRRKQGRLISKPFLEGYEIALQMAMLHHEIGFGVERINSARMVYFAGRPFLDGWSGGMSLLECLSAFFTTSPWNLWIVGLLASMTVTVCS